MRKLIFYAAVLAAFACIGAAFNSAHAQSYAFGAGSSFPSVVYRQLMDCLYNPAQGSPGKPGPLPKVEVCWSFNGSGDGGEILYYAATWADYKMSLRNNQLVAAGDPYRLLGLVNPDSVPYTDSTIGICDVALNPCTGIANADGYDG